MTHYHSVLQRGLAEPESQVMLAVTEDLVVGVTYEFDPDIEWAIVLERMSPCCGAHLVFHIERENGPGTLLAQRDTCEACGEVQDLDWPHEQRWCSTTFNESFEVTRPDHLTAWLMFWLELTDTDPLLAEVQAARVNDALISFAPEAERFTREYYG